MAKKTKNKHITLNRKKDLYLKMTPAKGRGVFCRGNIKRGELLEVTPALLLNEKQTDAIGDTILMNYVFVAGGISKKLKDKTKIKKTGDACCVVMGLASYCNHDAKPNAEVIWEEVEGKLFFSLRATRNIPKNTEICTAYGRGWFKDRE